jgi:hypothetical protein
MPIMQQQSWGSDAGCSDYSKAVLEFKEFHNSLITEAYILASGKAGYRTYHFIYRLWTWPALDSSLASGSRRKDSRQEVFLMFSKLFATVYCSYRSLAGKVTEKQSRGCLKVSLSFIKFS